MESSPVRIIDNLKRASAGESIDSALSHDEISGYNLGTTEREKLALVFT
jgi:hypothetical protein